MKKLIAVMLLLSWSIQASAITIDFEEKTPEPSPLAGQGPDFGSSQGFLFYRPDGEIQGGYVAPDLSTNVMATGNSSAVALDWCGQCGDGRLVMEAQNGSAFDLLGFDFIAIDPLALVQGTLTVTGTYVGSGTISHTLSGSMGVTSWDSASFGGGWAGLSSLTFTGEVEPLVFTTLLAVDNIQVNVIPIPAAVWLFGSGLGLLGFLRRKSQS